MGTPLGVNDTVFRWITKDILLALSSSLDSSKALTSPWMRKTQTNIQLQFPMTTPNLQNQIPMMDPAFEALGILLSCTTGLHL